MEMKSAENTARIVKCIRCKREFSSTMQMPRCKCGSYTRKK